MLFSRLCTQLLALYFVSGVLLLEVAAEDQTPVLYLESKPLSLEQSVGGIVPRELVRQAVYMSARDLGWRTRDATLREELRGNELQSAIGMKIALEATKTETGREIKATLLFEDEPIWEDQCTLNEGVDYYPVFIRMISQAANGPLAEKLRALAEQIPADEIPASTETEVTPEDREDWRDDLHEMHLIKQYLVARHLDRLAAKVGSSQAWGDLARAYAHLSLLTRHHWFGSSGVFTARSILCAERALARSTDDAQKQAAEWSRAYCYALVGRHGDSLAVLKELSDTGRDGSAPDWAKVIDPLCRFDREALMGIAAEESGLAGLAALLHFEASRSGNNATEFQHALVVAAEKSPLAPAMYAASAEPGRDFGLRRWGAAMGVEACNGLLRQRAFRHAAGLPEGTRGEMSKLEPDEEQVFPRVGLVAIMLIDSDDQWQDTRLSWQTLGRLLQEEVFVAGVGFITDAMNAVKSDLSPYTDSIAPLMLDHPYQEFIRAWGFDLETEFHLFQESLDQITLVDTRPHMTPHFGRLGRTSTKQYESFGTVAIRTALPDFTEHSLSDRCTTFWRMPAYAQTYAKLFPAVSPHSPKILRATILATEEPTDEQLTTWEATAIENRDAPALLLLHERIGPNDKTNTAIRLLEAVFELEPKAIYARMLAQRHLQAGDRDEWEATLKNYLKLDSQSFESSQIAHDLALRLMMERKWEDARPFAEIAGATYSAWGLACYARCLEGLGQLAVSEQVVQELASSYGGSSRTNWYLWCKRNDRGNLDGARAMAEATFTDPQRSNDYEFKSLVHQLEGETAEALNAMMEANQRNPTYWNEMEISLLAFDQKRPDLRTKALADLKKRSGERANDLLLAELVELAHLRKDEPIVTKEIDKYLKPDVSDVKCDVAYFAGECMQRLGQMERAKKYWEICRWSEVQRLTPTLAAARLREFDDE